MIISAALAVLKLHEEEILRVSSCDKFMEVSSSLGRTCFDADKLIKVALDTIGVMVVLFFLLIYGFSLSVSACHCPDVCEGDQAPEPRSHALLDRYGDQAPSREQKA